MSLDSPEINNESESAQGALNAATKTSESLDGVFIDDWRRAWRFFSLWFISAALILQSVWDSIPPDIKSDFPAHTQRNVTIVLLILGGLSRLIKQSNQASSNSETGQ